MRKVLHTDQLAGLRVLVRVPNWVGDAVLCLPALRALRRSLPEAELVLLARPWVADVFPVEEFRCRLLHYDTRKTHRGLAGRLRIASQLRSQGFGAAILFQNAFDAALISWLARIPIRAGYARQGRTPLLTHTVLPPRGGETPVHEAHYYLEMLRRLGLIPGYEPVEWISLPASEESRAVGRHELSRRLAQSSAATEPPRFVVGISPGASFGTAKRWPEERFAELAIRLVDELGAACVFFGSPQERRLVADVIAESATHSLSLAGQTSLAEFMGLVQGCDLFLTNDTGTMHVAAGLGVPTLALFGPTNEQETRPLGPHATVLVGEAFCRPCKLRHCPIDHRCMKSLSVDRVFQTACSLLLQEPSRAPVSVLQASAERSGSLS
jgi:heptosyltransferase-2